MKQATHKPGPLKQQNKTHKHGKHRSNRALDTENKGRRDVKSISKKSSKDIRKHDRRNQIAQVRKNKRDEVIAKKRALGGQGSPPILVSIISLNPANDPLSILESIKKCDDEAVITQSEFGSCHITFPRYKQRICFFIPKPGDLFSTLDAEKVSDVVLLLHTVHDLEDDDQDDVKSNRDLLQSSLLAHGFPSAIHVLEGMDLIAPKKRLELKKLLTKNLDKKFPEAKLTCLEKSQDSLLLVHQIISQKKQPITFRERRPYMLVESSEFHPDENGKGTLKVSGYIRGKVLDVNGLVHIPGQGSFQLIQIDAPDDPHPLIVNSRNVDPMVDLTVKVLGKSDSLHQESLVSENIPDPMDGEQTWPTKEELEMASSASDHQETVKVNRKVPVGTSSYQAAWIVEDGSDGEDDSDEDEGLDMDLDIQGKVLDALSMDDNESLQSEENESASQAYYETEKYDEKMNEEENMEMYEKFQEERMNEMFPDEIDTPVDKPARTRFARYRGLQSFQTSPWDPKESLPLNYSRIFQFENFNRTKKRVLNEEKDGVEPGWYVTLHVAKVPTSVYENLMKEKNIPILIYGLLPHENRMSLLNVAIKKHPLCTEPIKSKERLIFHVGFQRYSVCPLFSAHNTGDKHKYERFFRSDEPMVASFYAPLVYAPAPVLIYKAFEDGTQQLVATGSVLSVDPDRIVAKRIILSGHPFKINRRSVVVRYMFFNRDDILWFKPIELRTKYGRRGHIQEPLGTHGHMKCIFDAQLKSQDTVLMHLYKRVFPKWTLEWKVESPNPLFHPIFPPIMDDR